MDITAFDPETGEPLKAGDERWKEVWADLVEKGIIVPDKDAPPCMGCQEQLKKIHVKIVSTLIPDDPDPVITEDDFEWVPGLHQFNVAPGFFGFVQNNMAVFDATCGACGAPIAGLEIIEHPHGLTFSDESRVAGNL